MSYEVFGMNLTGVGTNKKGSIKFRIIGAIIQNKWDQKDRLMRGT